MSGETTKNLKELGDGTALYSFGKPPVTYHLNAKQCQQVADLTRTEMIVAFATTLPLLIFVIIMIRNNLIEYWEWPAAYLVVLVVGNHYLYVRHRVKISQIVSTAEIPHVQQVAPESAEIRRRNRL